MPFNIPQTPHFSEPPALRRALQEIDGCSYSSYQNIQGGYSCGSFRLTIDRVQKDPFAPPTLLRIRIPLCESGFSHDLFCNASRRTGFCDFLTRSVELCIENPECTAIGSGNSGRLIIASPGQEIVERSSIQLLGGWIEARLYLGLPARGRRILAEAACDLLLREIPEVVERSLFARSTDEQFMRTHVNVNEDQDVMRLQLRSLGLVAFVADGSVLPRRSGEDDRCPDRAGVVEFRSPDSSKARLKTRHQGEVDGMGVRSGVTVITGGGYHGKSTFLQALERGVYNHIPGDGREGVVTVGTAVKIRAEEGRSVRSVDLSTFLHNLPKGISCTEFSTANASGSTSQGASVVESIEAGATALLLDEDTSASNFLGRDDRVERLIPGPEEPIRPLVGSVRRLHSELGVSTILVAGSSGAFFGPADQVLRCKSFALEDVTTDAKRIAEWPARKGLEETPTELVSHQTTRRVLALGLPGTDRWIRVQGQVLLVGGERIRLEGLEQLVRDEGNAARSLASVLVFCAELIGDAPSTRSLLSRVETNIHLLGLDRISPRISGNLVRPRSIEIAGIINRLRSLEAR